MAIQTQTAPTTVAARASGRDAPAAEPSRDLSIAEMTRIMDVASVLRRERSVAEQQLDLASTKRLLRERLLDAARVSGDPVTAEEIDVAIEQYFATRHEFSPPKPGFQTLLAHLYVARGTILRWAVGLGAVAALGWALLG